MTAPEKPGLSNEELKPCPMNSCHPFGPTEVRELMPDYWMVQCLTAQHHVSVSGYKTKELAIEAWNRRAQSPPVAQVEVYREALEAIKQADNFGEIADHVVFRHKRMKASEVCDIALLTSKPEPVIDGCPKCKARIDGLRVCVECGFVMGPEPITADGPYTYSKHLRYEGPGLDEKPDSLSVRELNIAFSEGKKVNEKWLKEYQFQLNAAHSQAPVAPVRKWAKEDIIGHCGQCDADVEVHHTFAEVQAALNGRTKIDRT